MVNRRNPAAGDPYSLFNVADHSVIITGATAERAFAAQHGSEVTATSKAFAGPGGPSRKSVAVDHRSVPR